MLNVDLVPRQAPMGTDESIWQLDYCAVQVDDLDVIPAPFSSTVYMIFHPIEMDRIAVTIAPPLCTDGPCPTHL